MYEQLSEKTPARGIKLNQNLPAFLLRAGELAAAGGGLILLSPLLLFCALSIRLNSSGTILFRQNRVGRGGETFTLYKFRTMKMSGEGLPITAENDPRITSTGKFLRKTKIDEFPQLYNVLRGEMSFVGPRPEVPELVDFDSPKWQKILSVRPGITDPVTLEFRNEGLLLSEVDDKLAFYRETIQPRKLDGYLSYVETKSLKTDLKIIVQTLKAILFR